MEASADLGTARPIDGLPAAGAPPPAEAVAVWKRFGSTQALRDVSLRLERGHCLGLVGRNGAGKSTLVSIMSGLEPPDRGAVLFAGERAPSHNDRTGWAKRISTVYQHSMVVPWLTVAENVFLGRYPRTWYGRVDWRAMRTGTQAVMAEWGLDLEAREVCSQISVEQRQVVEIARALASGSRCLLLDEPTSALERNAVRRLFDRIRGLVDAGVAILYISHHLEEVFEICDEVAVVRDGEIVLSARTDQMDEALLVAAMVGDPTRRDRRDLRRPAERWRGRRMPRRRRRRPKQSRLESRRRSPRAGPSRRSRQLGGSSSAGRDWSSTTSQPTTRRAVPSRVSRSRCAAASAWG